MKRTLFRTPVVNSLFRCVSRVILTLIGWRVVGELPARQKFVLIGGPHTSNYDFGLMLMAVLVLRLEARWMGKDALFPWPLAGFMKWLGGIPIDRSKANNTVSQMVEHFNQQQELVVLIPPEGTRSKVERWKTGFYHIACGAGVPILLGFIDAAKKEVGVANLFYPSGDIEKDLPLIQAFYRDKQGLRPELQ